MNEMDYYNSIALDKEREIALSYVLSMLYEHVLIELQSYIVRTEKGTFAYRGKHVVRVYI